MWGGDLKKTVRETWVVASRSIVALAVGMTGLRAPVYQVGEQEVESQGWSERPIGPGNVARYYLEYPRSERVDKSLKVSGVPGGELTVTIWDGYKTNNPPPGSSFDQFTLGPFGGCSAETTVRPRICPLFRSSTGDIGTIESVDPYKGFFRMDYVMWIPNILNRERNALVPEFIGGSFSQN